VVTGTVAILFNYVPF